MTREIASKNVALVRKRIGEVELSQGMFTERQKDFFEKAIKIVDRNPVVQWGKGGTSHNQDFCLIEGKLEPVKAFHMKMAYLGGISITADTQPSIVNVGDDVVVTVPVTVTDGERTITMNGGSSFKEVDKYGNNSRRMHDAVARAQTRGMKIALENLMGFAFINLIMAEIFGGYEMNVPEEVVVEERGEKDAHKPDPQKMSGYARKIGTSIYRRITELVKAGKMTEEEKEKLWRRVQLNLDKEDVLVRILEEDVKQIEKGGPSEW